METGEGSIELSVGVGEAVGDVGSLSAATKLPPTTKTVEPTTLTGE